jgi:hypothetical protein
VSAKEAAKSAGESFTEMVKGAKELGTEGSKAMTDFIKDAKASGLKIPEITDYINEQLGVTKKSAMSAAAGLELMSKAPNMTIEAMRRLERQTVATFNAMKENGASFTEAMDALGPALDGILAQQKKMGIAASAGIASLLHIRDVTNAHRELFDAVDGNLAVMNALANTGSMTKEIFKDSTDQANDYYKQLMTAGLSGNEALAQMAPTLERIRFLAREHGYAIDDATKALIRQAEEQGLLKEEELETNDVLMAGFGEIIKCLGGDVPDAMMKAMEKMKKLGESGEDAAGTMQKSMENATGDMQGDIQALHDYVKNSNWDINSKWNVEGGPEEPSGGGGSCFTAGTKVRMADGSYKNIEDIKVGDEVTSYDTEERKQVKAEVCEVFQHGPSETSGVILINGTLEATPNHLVYTFDEWKRAGDLKIGDMVLLLNGAPDIVVKIEWKPGWVETFNIHTKHNTHNYFANDILVHNAKSAQKEFFGRVSGDRQVFIAHRGENVEIYHPEKHTSVDQIGAALANLADITAAGQQVYIEPIVLEKRDQIIIEFIVKQIQSGNIKIPTTSVGG